MKAYEIMEQIIGREYLAGHPDTCDTVKAGDPEREVRKIAAAFSATPKVLAAARDWGADLLIVHEPTFSGKEDKQLPGAQGELKHRLVDECGITVWRYHDSMHFRGVDQVTYDMVSRMGWTGNYDEHFRIVLDKPESVKSIARRLKRKFRLAHVRIVGNAGMKDVRDISLGIGEVGIYDDFLADGDKELVITGETCEWKYGEPIREAGELGLRKAMIMLGHCGSEKLSMELLAKNIDGLFDGAKARYFDTGELYKYL